MKNLKQKLNKFSNWINKNKTIKKYLGMSDKVFFITSMTLFIMVFTTFLMAFYFNISIYKLLSEEVGPIADEITTLENENEELLRKNENLKWIIESKIEEEWNFEEAKRRKHYK
jgi:hypothetical protein